MSSDGEQRQCTKRVFGSAQHAKRANRTANFRFRVYWCQDCRGYHVTNKEKR